MLYFSANIIYNIRKSFFSACARARVDRKWNGGAYGDRAFGYNGKIDFAL